MRRRLIASVLLVSMLFVSGCGSVVPKLTEDEQELVSEYAASLLLKYDSENHSRLVDTTEFMNQYNAALAAREESIRLYEEEKERQKAEREAAKAEAEAELAASKEEAENRDDGTGGATIIGGPESYQPQMTIAEYFGASGFRIEFAGYDILEHYPEDSAAPISASTGRDLLVAYFNTTSDNGGTLDLFNRNANFKISYNGSPYSSNYMTVLDDDLSQYYGDFGPGETKRLVVIFEVPKGTNISSLSMSLDSLENDTMVVTLIQ